MNSRSKKSAKKQKGVEDQVPDRLPYSRRTKMLVAVATAIGTITGAVIGINTAGPIIEPYIPATRAYVREAQNSVTSILRDLQIEQAQGKVDGNKDAQAKWKLELQKTQDPTSQALIKNHLDELDRQDSRLADQLGTLKSLKSKDR